MQDDTEKLTIADPDDIAQTPTFGPHCSVSSKKRLATLTKIWRASRAQCRHPTSAQSNLGSAWRCVGWGPSGLPIPGKPLVDFLGGIVAQFGEHESEPRLRI
jgi:hypothetical protein